MQYITFDPAKEYDLILLGRVAIDFNPVDLNRPLEESSNFNKYLGGSPANIAVGMARLGKKVGFIARVSDDQFGDYVTHYFEKEGIDTSHITRCKNGENLGLTFTEILSPSESRILMYRDGVADLMLEPENVDEEYIKKAKALLISGTALAASPSREAALKAVMLAKKNGVAVIFDIDYRAYTWKNPDEISIYYSTVAKESDLILGSREEFDLTERLTGLSGEGDSSKADFAEGNSMEGNQSEAGSSRDGRSAKYWQSYGCKIVVIKHGKEGSTAYTCDGNHYAVKPFPTNALKGFGGGDGYASSFIRALIDGCSVPQALEYGSASASMLISAHSCSAAMPTLEEVERFIREEKEKYGEMVARA
ncbi:MAG: 5-dehydro-2-deoxygluconokinase [Roseburia sp.]|nr:5-dehydro-2-deoxygluconokinase [Roseburia sp.]MCM1097219.1 5-dehydro-2-deoxygluconokinase [Ruminococcus flavefaciens]